MASLSVGSNNFPTRVYENPPDLVAWLASEMQKYEVVPEVEAFDLSHILQALRLHDEGKLFGKLYVQFVMGVKNAMPADRAVFGRRRGLGVPFFISAVLVNNFLLTYKRFQKYIGATRVVAGIFLVIVGLLVFTNSLGAISQYLLSMRGGR